MKIIFLDVDGVINSKEYMIELNGTFGSGPKHRQIDPKAVARLNQITDATGAYLVLSSTWRIIFKRIVEIRELFAKAGVTGKFLGTTPINNQIRGLQIQEWLDSYSRFHKVEKFVILDDDSDMGDLKPYLIKTNHDTGLTDADVVTTIEALK